MPSAPARSSPVTAARRRLLRRGMLLEGLTIGYNIAEAIIAITAGIFAGSVALVGFGFDSIIEVIAATVVGHRLLAETRGGSVQEAARQESRALKVVAVTFFLLSAYILWDAARKLGGFEPPLPSLIGIIIAALSVLLMPALGWMKHRTGRALGSKALMADAKETMVCWYLSVTLLLGLGLNAALGWWWADPVAALAMIPLLIHEGREAWEEAGESD
ncbi:MAG: cation transporter [Acidobacteria bacterium]|nr:cation transporter [Acidobacteriota bacterium]